MGSLKRWDTECNVHNKLTIYFLSTNIRLLVLLKISVQDIPTRELSSPPFSLSQPHFVPKFTPFQ